MLINIKYEEFIIIFWIFVMFFLLMELLSVCLLIFRVVKVMNLLISILIKWVMIVSKEFFKNKYVFYMIDYKYRIRL